MKTTDYNSADNIWKIAFEKGVEVFYGRKSWELVYFLECDTKDECFSELTLDKWIDLQEALAPIGPSLEEISNAFNTDHPDGHDLYLMRKYKEWYDHTFDYSPILGYDFSVGYMRTFWEAADTVLKYLEDPEWKVFMFASY